MTTPEERFWSKVDKDGPVHPVLGTPCWLWLTGTTVSGYGQILIRNEHWRAHRFSWVLRNGPISEGLRILHRCDVRRCVNPGHLFSGTDGDNVRDCQAKGRARHPRMEQYRARTHCNHGHEFTPENTRIRIHDGRNHGRKCRECARIEGRRCYYASKSA